MWPCCQGTQFLVVALLLVCSLWPHHLDTKHFCLSLKLYSITLSRCRIVIVAKLKKFYNHNFFRSSIQSLDPRFSRMDDLSFHFSSFFVFPLSVLSFLLPRPGLYLFLVKEQNLVSNFTNRIFFTSKNTWQTENPKL